MLNWLINWWYARTRAVDLSILWPICVEKAPDLDHARAAFAVHAFNDPAWLALGEVTLAQFINDLKP